MKVKFSNAEVDVWKLRKGTVVKYDYHFYHIKDIVLVDVRHDEFVATLYITCAEIQERVYSSDVTWLEPHD
jgi:hypothetical protein